MASAESSDSSSEDTRTMHITVTFRGTTHPLAVLPDSTLAALQLQLEELTSVPPSLQKLLYKGKKPNVSNEVTLVQVGLKDGAKVQMLGSTEAELSGMKVAENELRKKEEVLKRRAENAKNLPKPRSTGFSSSSAPSARYCFHNIVPLPHLPNPASAHAILAKLAADPAIAHVMQRHQFSVYVLTELAPHEQPHLLGLNTNFGETIKLRLRTDAYDGFRLYSDVRKVLCHELAHNVYGEHDNNFKALNSLLNKEVADFERAQREGTNTLRGSGPVYTPSSSALELESEAHGHILGSSGTRMSSSNIIGGSGSGNSNSQILIGRSSNAHVLGGSGSISQDTLEDRRRRALEAVLSRVQREEEKLEQSCGTAGPARDSEAGSSEPTSN